MTVKINADTSDGLKLVSDTSGAIDFQSNGTTVASLDSSGNFSHNGIEVDMWRLTTNQTADGNLTNLERCDDASFSKIGTGLSFDSSGGIFTFPRTGVYQILVQATGRAGAGDTVAIWTQVSQDDFTTNDITSQTTVGDDDASNTAAFGQQFVNITNTSTHKVRFYAASIASGSYIQGDTDSNVTSFSFIRLGDSQ
tara:strand:- start:2381 stop:2968 length:588 start_codon:yes stop_codon:yes gene_type:complete